MGGGGKTSKQETETKQRVDKDLVKDYGGLTEAGKLLTALRTQPNRNVTIADFTPQQKAAFEATQGAANAFGMPAASSTGMPEASKSASGISGFSTAPEFDRAVAALPDSYKNSSNAFYDMLTGKTKPKEDEDKKKSSTSGKITTNAEESNNPFAGTVMKAFGGLVK